MTRSIGRLRLMTLLALASTPAVWSSTRQIEAAPPVATGALPITREYRYTVDARVRPLLLFWIGRNDIGEARITWRADSAGRRALEFLIGSDPARAPRRINRWGFLTEVLDTERSDVLGIMKESGEQTLAEAEASVANGDGGTIFKVSRSTIVHNTAAGGTIAVSAPGDLTYRDLADLLSIIPPEPPSVRTLGLPADTKHGFLTALEMLLSLNIDSCRDERNVRATPRTLPYVYNQTLYDLSLVSCDHEAELRSRVGIFEDVIDGRFTVTNRTTRNKTDFRVMYGASGTRRRQPLRAVFRPHWWIEVELLLQPPGNTLSDNSSQTASARRIQE